MKQELLKRITLILIAFFCCNEMSFGQCETIDPSNGQINISPIGQTNTYKFEVTDLDNSINETDLIIWFFGDGHYATGRIVTHGYADTGGYKVTVYNARGPGPGSTIYVPEPPSIYRGYHNVQLTNSTGSGYGAPGSNSIDIQVNTTWNITPTDLNYHYFILTLTNNDTEDFAGTIELYSDPAISYNEGSCLLPLDVNRENWYTGATLEQGFPEIDVDNLEPGETRQYYVQASLATDYDLSAQPIIHTTATIYDTGKDKIAEGGLRSFVSLHPHDPNSITVLQESICPYVDVPQELDKIIRFQNIGAYFATDVKLLMLNSSFHEPNSIQIIDHSHNMQELIVTGSINRINFFDINLPGLAQSSPNQYAPSQCSGWVHVRFTILPCVDSDVNMSSTARITFDDQPSIWTNKYITLIDKEDCVGLPLCEVEEDEGGEVANYHGTGGGSSNTLDAYTIQPNPFREQFSINVPARDAAFWISISDMRGANVHRERLEAGDELRHTINTDSWQDGLYLVHIYNAEESKVIKCIKQR